MEREEEEEKEMRGNTEGISNLNKADVSYIYMYVLSPLLVTAIAYTSTLEHPSSSYLVPNQHNGYMSISVFDSLDLLTDL